MTAVIVASVLLGVIALMSFAGTVAADRQGHRAGWAVSLALAAGIIGFFVGLSWGRP